MERKKKKIPKALAELKNIILENHTLLNVPEKNTQLIKNTTSFGSIVDIHKYDCDNLIPQNNLLQIDVNNPTKDKLFKTHIHVLHPNRKQQKILLKFFDSYTDMYNLTVKKIKTERKIQKEQAVEFNKQQPKDKQINTNIRYCDMTYMPVNDDLRKFLKKEKKLLIKKYKTQSHLLDYAINDVITMFKSIKTNQLHGHIYNSKMRFLKKSRNNRIFKIEKGMCTDESFCNRILGDKMKVLPKMNFKKDMQKVHIIQYNKKQNKFYLYRRKRIVQKEINTINNSITIDPGVRTIVTGISENHVLEMGTRLSEHIKKNIIKMRRLENKKKWNKVRKYEKYIQNYVTDFQWKTSLYLVRNYDHILIGSFSTRNMKKMYNGVDLEVMKSLNMYSFREKIKYKCLTHSKKYKKVNEAYTTKLCVNCSEYNDIGSSKIYTCKKCNKTYDRDIKSAGCIYMKALQK